MQQEAEQNGTLKIWNEFSRFYPWFRFHLVYLLGGVDQFDVGTSVLGSNVVTAAQNFADRIRGYIKDIEWDLFGDWVADEVV